MLRKQVRAALLARFPRLRDWVRSGRRTGSRLDSRRVKFTGHVHAPSDLHPVLSDPDLLVLARPKAVFLDPETLLRSHSSEHLDPVVEMNQMRQSPASVCFVVPVRGSNRTSLERALQSALRQTDASWELLLCCTSENAEAVAEWLDIDWRVRRVEMADLGTESQLLKAAAMYATTEFIRLLPEGEVDDDFVRALGEMLPKSPELDVVHAQAAHSVRHFPAVRKRLLLAVQASMGLEDATGEDQLLRAAIAKARSVGHIHP